MLGESSESTEIVETILNEIKGGYSNKGEIDQIIRDYHMLLNKYQSLALDHHSQALNSKKSVDHLLKHIEALNQENQRLMLENALLSQNNIDMSLRLQRYLDSGQDNTHCLRVRNDKRI